MVAIAWVMLQLHFLPLIYVVAAAGLFTFISGVIYVMDGVRQLQAEATPTRRSAERAARRFMTPDARITPAKWPSSAGQTSASPRSSIGSPGRNIAIVHDQPGMTRDRLAAPRNRARAIHHLGHGRNRRRG